MFCSIFFLLAMVHKRFARDGWLYTQEEFCDWYGTFRGNQYWKEALGFWEFPIPAGDGVEELIKIRFCLLSGDQVCDALEVSSKARVDALDIRRYLRGHSHHEDDMRKLDWHSKLLIPGPPPRVLDFKQDCDIFRLEEVSNTLASTPGVLSLQVIRQPLWED